MYPGEWKGVPDHKAGVATFMVDGKRYDIKLESFADYLQIEEMLDSANQMGKEFGADAVCDAAVRAAHKRNDELHS